MSHEVHERTPLVPLVGFPDGRGPACASFSSALFNLTKGIIGIGLLGLPFTFQSAGIVPGIAMLCLCSFLGAFSAMLLHSSGQSCGHFSYPAISAAAWGSRGILVVNIVSSVYGFGSSVAFLMVIKTTIEPLLSVWPIATPEVVLVAICLAVVLPLSLLRYQHNLRFASFAASLFNFYTLFAIILRCDQLDLSKSHFKLFTNTSGIFLAFPMIALAFSFHLQFLPLVSELKDISSPAVLRLNVVTQTIVLTFYSTFSLAGYLSFGPVTRSNILQNYPPSDPIILAARLGLASGVALSYPLFWLSLRDTLDGFLFPNAAKTFSTSHLLHSHTLRTRILAVAFISVSLVLALTIPSLETAFQFTGALGVCTLSYVLPGLLYISLTTHPWYRPSVLAAATLSATGVVVICLFLSSFFMMRTP